MPFLYKKLTDRDRLDFLLKHEAIPISNPRGWTLTIVGKQTASFTGPTPRLAIDEAIITLQGRKRYEYPASDTAS